jgi:hypothetical protein
MLGDGVGLNFLKTEWRGGWVNEHVKKRVCNPSLDISCSFYCSLWCGVYNWDKRRVLVSNAYLEADGRQKHVQSLGYRYIKALPYQVNSRSCVERRR